MSIAPGSIVWSHGSDCGVRAAGIIRPAPQRTFRSDPRGDHERAGVPARVEAQAGISPHSLEITITETPKVNWGIRGQNAADLTLNYRVEV
jgi:hypothetical protein